MVRIKSTEEKIDGHCSLPILVGEHFFVEGSKIKTKETLPRRPTKGTTVDINRMVEEYYNQAGKSHSLTSDRLMKQCT